MTKKKLDDYVNNMDIPKPEDVLPQECIRKEGLTDGNRNTDDDNNNVHSEDAVRVVSIDSKRKRRWMYVGATGLVACCAAFSLLVVKPWDKRDAQAIMSDTSKNEASIEKEASADKSSTSEKTDGLDSANKGEDGSASKDYLDGVIGESIYKDPINGLDEEVGKFDEEYITDDAVVAPMSPDSFGSETAESGSSDWEVIGGEEYYEPGVEPGSVYSAGTLTGGEIRDLKNWDNWSHVVDKEYMETWNLLPEERFVVYVHNGDKGVNNVKVKLLAGDKVIYEAVTADDGYAYLFYNYGKNAGQQPDSIQVENKDGKFDSYSIADNANSKNEIEVSSDISNDIVKLDLMFVVDTTGSMQDELDYLKAELEDVIARVEDETGATIRTSVNFYRDEGDEYEVKYYDFRDDAKEVTKILNEQNADGGGDWEEAVHKALDNAINQHSWDEESNVKLMFLVLDAPPHDDEDVKTKLVELVEKASAQGIRIIPVAASGADDNTQQLLRSFAIMTGGTFIFLDDKSGVGIPHDVPLDPSEYNSEYLNDMLIRIIGQYCGVDIDTSVVPDPEPTPRPNEN